jgi:hypothetical protein
MKSNQTLMVHGVKSVRLHPVQFAAKPDGSNDVLCWREIEIQHTGGRCTVTLFPQREDKETQLQIVTTSQIVL